MPSGIGTPHQRSPVWILCHAGEQSLADQKYHYLLASGTMTQWPTRQSKVVSDLRGCLGE
jgi:hypothetical protein